MENVKNFLISLYENDHFSLYLTIVLIVLIIIFIIVFIFGKKDKKLEETRRLNKEEIEKAAFKEEKKEAKKLEAKEKKKEEVKEDSLPVDEKEPTVTIFEPSSMEKEEMPEKAIPEIDMPIKVNKASKDTEEEEAPIKLDEIKDIDLKKIDNELENELSELENIKNKFNDIKLPEIKKKEEVKEEPKKEEVPEEKHYQPTEVFSSVYAPPKKEETDDEFDLPTLKSEPKEENKEENKEEKENNKPTFDFNKIQGESYHINGR